MADVTENKGGKGTTVEKALDDEPAAEHEKKPEAGDKDEQSLEEKMKGATVGEAIDRDALKAELSGLIQVDESDLFVRQDDPDSPLHSIKSFDELGLTEELKKGVYTSLKFRKPSKIQELALPMILANPPRNLMAQAQSGTGKTAAFVLGMLSRCNPAEKGLQAVCVCHTRELALQVLEVVRLMSEHTQILSTGIIKDFTPERPLSDYHLVVGTPGKLRDMFRLRAEGGEGDRGSGRGRGGRGGRGGRRGGGGAFGKSMVRLLETVNVKILVVDEADELLGKQGLKEQAMFVRHQLPKRLQILLFSATFADSVKVFVKTFIPNPNIIALKPQQVSLDQIKQFWVRCENEAQKFEYLSEIYGFLTMGQSIIFVHRRDSARNLCEHMTKAGHAVSLLHGGDMASEERDRVMNDFRQGKTKVLITTNVLARGIDVLQTSVVINYDIPMDERGNPDVETYIHRIGRSGRFGRKGVAITFVHSQESHTMLEFIKRSIQDKYAGGLSIQRLDPTDLEALEGLQ